MRRITLRHGLHHFDTAESYGAGHDEELVGEALAPIRNTVIIATKFFIGPKLRPRRQSLKCARGCGSRRLR